MNIDEMPTGPMMDALVAEEVMELRIRHRTDILPRECEGGLPLFPETYEGTILSPSTGVAEEVWVPALNYSGDMANAWEVVGKIHRLGHFLHLSYNGDKWLAVFVDKDTWDTWAEPGSAPTAPLAICRAAYKLVEQMGDEHPGL